jgi:hypothetical protein
MAARAAIALCLACLAGLGWAGAARAQDNPACAQYHEAMAYNLCLSQHGPKANGVGQLHGGPQPGHAAQNQTLYGHSRGAPIARYYSPPGAHGRVHMEFPVR